jgi:hypothetical protein
MEPIQITKIYERHYHDQHLDLDFGNRTALLDGEPLTLTRKEYDLLAFLIEHAGALVTRETLLLCVWGYSNQIRTQLVSVAKPWKVNELSRPCRHTSPFMHLSCRDESLWRVRQALAEHGGWMRAA